MEENTYPMIWSQGSRTTIGYMIEARLRTDDEMVSEKIVKSTGIKLSRKWRRVVATPSPIGVPVDIGPEGLVEGIMPYASAQALRWWFVAAADAMAFGIETRLVRHKFECTFSQVAEEAIEEFGGTANFQEERAAASPLREGGE